MHSIVAPILSPSLPPLPFPLSSCVSLFFGAHMVWRWKTEALEIYRNRSSYLSGRCFRYLVSYTPMAGQSIYPLTKITLIGRHYLELQAQYEKTWKSYRTFVKTLLFQRTYDFKIPWDRGMRADKFLGAASNRWLRIQAMTLARTPLELFRSSMQLLGNMFLTAHHSVMVLESLRWNAESLNERSVDKFFININVVLDHHKEISRSQTMLVAQLKKVQPLLSNRFLSEDMTSHLLFVIDYLEQNAEKAEEIANVVEDLTGICKGLSGMGAQVLKELGKSCANAGSQFAFGFPVYNDFNEFVPPPTYSARIFDPQKIRLKQPAL